jgi:uncharacterized PurR-regulated membrane protein YhhQ (DUF165 family)
MIRFNPTAALYLAALVASNLTIALLGPSATVAVAALGIGPTLSLRDRLHEEWAGPHLKSNMLALLLLGAVLSGAVSLLPTGFAWSAARIAAASATAIFAADVADALVYHRLRERWGFLARVNGSNVVGAAVDSLLFPLLAFGVWLPWIVAGQFAAKVLGGAVWSVVLAGRQARRVRVEAA